MWKLDCKESWEPKNWCFWSEVLEMTLESPLDCKEIQPVHPKGNQSWIFIWKNWCWSWNSNILQPNAWNWLYGKDPDAGKDWGQEEKETTEDEMVGLHHRFNGHEFEWTLGVGDRQGSLVAAVHESQSPTWLSDWTEHINYIEVQSSNHLQ